MEINVEEFALVKSIRARGKRIAPYLIDQVEELPPLKESPIFEEVSEEPHGDEPEEEADLFSSSSDEAPTE